MDGKKQETVSDIVAEMRIELNKARQDIDLEKVHDFPDRIEAAMKRYCEDCTWYHIYNTGLSELNAEKDRLRADKIEKCKGKGHYEMSIETLDKTLDKTLSTIRKVEKAICIPMALICIIAAIGDFSHGNHFWGTAYALVTVYWMNMVRTCFLMKQKSRVNSL